MKFVKEAAHAPLHALAVEKQEHYQVRFLSILSCCVVPRQARAKRDRDLEKTGVAAAADDPVVELKSMVTTLSCCHTLVTIMTQLGFALVLLGILAYFWTPGLPRAPGIFASALLGTCLLAIGAVITRQGNRLHV
ncbi:hypothetical protein V8D89_006697 [Ganoderma adspersum]